MSFHSDLMTALKADAVTALAFVSAQVYHGRSAQRVPDVRGEVWVQPTTVRNEARGGGAQDQAHEYRIHVRAKGKREGNLTGAIQQDALKAHAETLRRRWDGYRLAGAVADLVALRVEEDAPDAPPQPDSDPTGLDGLDLSFVLVAVER